LKTIDVQQVEERKASGNVRVRTPEIGIKSTGPRCSRAETEADGDGRSSRREKTFEHGDRAKTGAFTKMSHDAENEKGVFKNLANGEAGRHFKKGVCPEVHAAKQVADRPERGIEREIGVQPGKQWFGGGNARGGWFEGIRGNRKGKRFSGVPGNNCAVRKELVGEKMVSAFPKPGRTTEETILLFKPPRFRK